MRKSRYYPEDISIVIPTYNSENTIDDLMRSILSQKRQSGEIIIVDDCSTDRTVQIIEKYSVKIIINEKNRGAATSRNSGVREAKGDIILFLDSDTYLMPGAIDAVLNGFNENQSINAQNGVCLSDPLNRGWCPLYKGLLESSWSEHSVNWDDKGKCINARIGAIVKSSILEFGGFDEGYVKASVEDHEFGIRYTKKYKIHQNKGLRVRHHFPEFLQTVKNYWQRTHGIMDLMASQKESVLDSGGVSQNSALEYLIGASLFFLLPLSFFHLYLFYIWMLVLFLFIYFARKALKRMVSRGVVFGIFSSVLHAFYGLIITSSASVYYLKRFLRSS